MGDVLDEAPEQDESIIAPADTDGAVVAPADTAESAAVPADTAEYTVVPANTDESAVAPAGETGAARPEPLTKQDFEALARFRFAIRAYLRFSEDAVRAAGLTPQQYQLLLALKGFPGRDWASVRELADRLLLRHHSVVELVGRAQKQGLVRRTAHPSDGRAVRVTLAPAGERVLTRLGTLHRDELRRMDTAILPPEWESASPPFDGN